MIYVWLRFESFERVVSGWLKELREVRRSAERR